MTQATIIRQDNVVTFSVLVSGGELAITFRPNGTQAYWWNTHRLSAAEFRRLWLLKRPN